MGKVYKNKGTESISRNLIFDNELSDRARFVYCFMMAKPDKWDFYITPMAKELGYSPDTLHKYINELIQRGWLTKVEQSRDERNKFGSVDYIIHEIRQERNTDGEESRDREKPSRKKAVTEKSRHGKIPPQKDNIDNKEILNGEEKKEEQDIASMFIDAEVVKEKSPEKEPRSEQRVYSLQYKCQKFFMQEYEKHKGVPYKYSAKDASNLKGIIDGLRFVLKNSNQPFDDDSVEVHFVEFINSLLIIKPDKWVDSHLSLPIINSKFNEIYSQLKNGKQPTPADIQRAFGSRNITPDILDILA